MNRQSGAVAPTPFGPVDILGRPVGVRNFDELAANAVQFDLGDGLRVDVCHLDDPIRMKRAAGRPMDRIELEVLGAVREERSSFGYRRRSAAHRAKILVTAATD